MHSFKDSNDVHWDLKLTIGAAKLIRSRLEFDIIGGDPSTTATHLHSDPYLRSECAWLMVQNKEGRKQEEFDNGLGSEAIRDCEKSFWAAHSVFVQELWPGQAEAIRELLETLTKESEKQIAVMIELANNQDAMDYIANVTEKAKLEALTTLGKISKESAEDLASLQPTT